MSRPIKFRAWFEPTHEYKCEYIDRYGHELEDIECHYYTEEDFLDDSWCNTSDYESIVFEQYTGVNDKNGKEIYEGDIIRDIDFCHKEHIAEISWLISEAKFLCESDNNACWDFYDMRGDDIEVIGNIHENPELLEAE